MDDEWESTIVAAVVRRLEREGWQTIVVKPETKWSVGDEFEAAALYAVEEERPDGVLLDVRFGEEKEERFQGLSILGKLVERNPKLPILMFTQYTQGPDRDAVASGALRQGAPVDFIDKLASPEEVILRFRRLIGASPDKIIIGGRITLDAEAKLVSVTTGGGTKMVDDIQGMKFEILRELDSLGTALGRRFGAAEFIINVRDQGYRLSPPGD